jgi:hypothetical protein
VEGGAKIFGVFRVKNHDFTPKKSYFFPILDPPDSPWNWDRETRIKAQCLLSTIKTAMFIVAFITVKNCLEIIKPLSRN